MQVSEQLTIINEQWINRMSYQVEFTETALKICNAVRVKTVT